MFNMTIYQKYNIKVITINAILISNYNRTKQVQFYSDLHKDNIEIPLRAVESLLFLSSINWKSTLFGGAKTAV